MNRREFLATGAVASVANAGLSGVADAPVTHQASGVKVGEVTHESAIVWARLTAGAARPNGGAARSRSAGRRRIRKRPT